MMKLKYIAPNFFTISSLFIGFLGINFVADGHYVAACWMVVISVFCDGLDGKVARLLNAQSKIGAEMDSFVDFFSFGVVPAFIAYRVALSDLGIIGLFATFIYILAGLFRLIRFNIGNTNLEEKSNFKGLPIPAASGLIITFVLLNEKLFNEVARPVLLLMIMIITAYLMVSKIEYVHTEKVNKYKRAKHFTINAIVFLTILATFFYPIYTFFTIAYLYAFIGFIKHTKKTISLKNHSFDFLEKKDK